MCGYIGTFGDLWDEGKELASSMFEGPSALPFLIGDVSGSIFH